MPTAEAAAPDGKLIAIHFWPSFQVRQRATPVANLSPWVNVVSRHPVAGAKVAMVMNENHKPGTGESQGITFQRVLFDRSEAVAHRDGGSHARTWREEQPAAQDNTGFSCEFQIVSRNHGEGPSLTIGWAHVYSEYEYFNYDARAVLEADEYIIVPVIARAKTKRGISMENEHLFLFRVEADKIVWGRIYADTARGRDVLEGREPRRYPKLIL
jgi:hypothetical protein